MRKNLSAQTYANQYLSGFRLEQVINEMPDLTDRQRQVAIRFFLKLEDPAIIGEDIGLTYERVRQIAQKAQRRIAYRLNRFPAMEKEIANYSAKVRLLEYRIQKMALQLKAQQVSESNFETVDIIDIEDVNLSVRLYNTLKAARINHIGQIRELSRHDFLLCRNAGQKSFNELRETMAEYGIKWPEK